MKKKMYLAPKVKRVDLAVKNAVLGSCHSSTNTQPKNTGLPGCAGNCSLNFCFTPGNQ